MEAIVDAALAIATRDGFDAMTMSRVAEDVGCAVGALYRYFPSKDALFLTLQSRVLARVAEDLVAAAARAPTSALPPAWAPLVRLVAVLEAYAALPRRRPAEFALLHRWLGDPGFLLDAATAQTQWRALVVHFTPLIGLLDACARGGLLEPGDAGLRLYVLWGSLQGGLQLARFDRLGEPGLDSRQILRATIRSLLRGFGAAADAVDAALACANAHAAVDQGSTAAARR